MWIEDLRASSDTHEDAEGNREKNLRDNVAEKTAPAVVLVTMSTETVAVAVTVRAMRTMRTMRAMRTK